ncbi:hypothetical protein BaRGS_00024692, partial [Batillaria attramentaria]
MENQRNRIVSTVYQTTLARRCHITSTQPLIEHSQRRDRFRCLEVVRVPFLFSPNTCLSLGLSICPPPVSPRRARPNRCAVVLLLANFASPSLQLV